MIKVLILTLLVGGFLKAVWYLVYVCAFFLYGISFLPPYAAKIHAEIFMNPFLAWFFVYPVRTPPTLSG